MTRLDWLAVVSLGLAVAGMAYRTAMTFALLSAY